jgi:exonuclease III
MFIQGRGFGGCSIIWKRILNAKITPILLSSTRLCAVLVVMDSCTFIIFNVYMPCDSRSNMSLYMSVWEEIINTCDQQDCNNIIIGGDLNTSLDRPDSVFTQYLEQVLRVENLHMCINSTASCIDFTFTSPVNHSNHTIDHFIVSNSLYAHVSKYTSMHDGDNVSFHSAVSLEFNIEVSYLSDSSRNFTP